MKEEQPRFIIKRNLQKSKITKKYFSDVITNDVLDDVCYKITGRIDYSCQFVDNDYQDEYLENTYNKGRIAILLYENCVNYISFSENEIKGRNSSVQSVPTAYNMYFKSRNKNKHIFYYFLNNSIGNNSTEYQIFIYRLMKTIGFIFLNTNINLNRRILPFKSVDDIINNRQINSNRNTGNTSSYVTKNENNKIEIYGKTYGANKYETSLLCYAVSLLAVDNQSIILYEMLEKDLKELPSSSLEVLNMMGNIEVVKTDMYLEKEIYDRRCNLRSPRYTFNLLNKLGNKHCYLCDCAIPELIQGAHIWPVSNIKRNNTLTIDEKIQFCIDEDNGIWLCENHHKLFDENIICFDINGRIRIKNNISNDDYNYICDITKYNALPIDVLSNNFKWFLMKRYENCQ